MKNVLSKKRLNLYIINLMALIPLICFICPHYSVVSYGLANNYAQHIKDFLGSMRFFGAFIIKCWTSVFDPISNPCIDLIIYIIFTSIIISTFSLFLQNKFTMKSNRELVLLDVSVLISFSNIWINNILTFPECIFLLSIGNVLCCLSLVFFFIEDKRKIWHIVLSSIFLVLSTAIYQQYLVIFIIYSIIIVSVCVLQNNATKKETFFDYIRLGIFCVLSEIIYYFLGRLIQIIWNIHPNSRIDISVDGIINRIKYFVIHQHSFLKGRGFFQTEVLTIGFGIVFIVWIIAIVFYTKNKKQYFKFGLITLSYIVGYSSSFLLGLLSTSTGIRTMLGLFSVFGLFSIGSVALLKKKTICSCLNVVLVLVFILNISKTVEMSVAQYQTNTIELTYANLYLSEINQHELNHAKIEKIEICTDASCDTIQKTENALSYSEYFRGLMFYVSGRNYEVSEMSDNQYLKVFSETDWKYFVPSKQMIYSGDTLYLCIY